MHRFGCGLLLCLCSLSLCAFAQENRIVRIGVAIMQRRPTQISGWGYVGLNSEVRDLLVSALNQEKADKKRHVKVEAVPLDGTTPDNVGTEATQKNCAYVVSTTLVEWSRPGQPDPGGPYSRNQGQIGGIKGGDQVTVEYKLYRTGDSSAISTGSASNHDVMLRSSDLFTPVMNQIASRIFADVKKATPPVQP